MTCLHCYHWREYGCYLGRPQFPDDASECAAFEREPGADDDKGDDDEVGRV